ncbi:MAG TPA: ABC transporter permease [Candidatus Acidoferrum sp.]|nr:ABC transporter permease [Candidatus Acidoferrum sp.]
MTWWQRFWRRNKMEEQLDKELRFQLEEHTNDLIAQGHDPEEARRMARLALGGPEQVKEDCRDARGTRWLEDLLQDGRYALRMLRKNPGFAAVALLTLALGSGATTVMFTVVNGVMLKPYPYPRPEKLLWLQEKTEKATRQGNLWGYTYPNYLDCKKEIRSLDVAAIRFSGGALREPDKAEYVNGREVSSEFFSILGVNMVRGHGFSSEDDRLGAAPVVIISNGLWQRIYNGSPDAIGQTLVLDSKSYSIIGVLPASFKWADQPNLDVFTPLGQDTSPALQRRDRHGLNVVARLRPGATLAEARTELDVIGHQLAMQYPDTNEGRTFIADPLRPNVGDVGSTLWLLLGAVSLVLLIACANVANLLLARAVSREREFAMRAALGAKRSRLARQCLTESAVLGLSGGAIGVLIAAIGIRPFVAFWPGSLPRAKEIQLDWRVMLFALAVSLLCGLLFGLAPALRLPVRNLENRIRSGGRTVAGHSRRLHGSFVVSEIALAVVLLVSAGILGRTLLRLSSLESGVNIHNVLTARMELPPATLTVPGQILPAWEDVLNHARRVPGVESAAIVDTIPMREGYNQITYWPSPALPPANQAPEALATSVSPDYFKVMGIPLLEGRFFDDHDRKGSELVAVIDDVLAKAAFGAQDPIGKRLWIPDTYSPFSDGPTGADVVRVIGLVGHVRHWGPAGDDDSRLRAQFYYPFAQVADTNLRRWSEVSSIVVRTTTPPLNLVEPLEREVRGPTGDQVLNEIQTMEQIATATLTQQRMLMLLFGAFAGLALLLACIGVYGVLAYLTSQRVPEIGVRMALGATAGNVIQLILRQSLGMIFAGVGLGVAGAVVAGRLLERFVAGVRSIEPFTFAAMVALLVVAALFASFVPARRASFVDPVKALRQD